MTNTPAGWYPDSENPGQQRYWDGTAWTEHRHPAAVSVPSGGGRGNGAAPDDRPWFKKKRFAIPLGVFVFLVIVGIAGGGESGTTTDDATVASDAGSSDTEASAEADAEDEPPADTEPAESQEPTVTANAADMVKEFEDNELAADSKYKGKWVQVNGVVNKIDTEMFNSKEYILQIGSGSEWELLTVNCHDIPNDVLSTLSTGNAVSVVGEFSDGGNLGVELKNCRLA